eukprot:NODE_461_length_8173_cov_0.353604.p6 type:complete len:138 gc:universal NODE_461_length_8173_cov_0.353604:5339-5752(+)
MLSLKRFAANSLESLQKIKTLMDNDGSKYAVLQLKGREYKVQEKDIIVLNRLKQQNSVVPIGSKLNLDLIKELGTKHFYVQGQPFVEGAKVVCTVMEHRLSHKYVIEKFKRRKRYSKKIGHRQPLSVLRVNCIDWPQ